MRSGVHRAIWRASRNCRDCIRFVSTSPTGSRSKMHSTLRSPKLVIINVTSLASRLPVPFMAAYNAAKAAMASFTMSIQLELGNSRVQVVDLQPADIRTEFNQGVIKSAESNLRYDTKVARTWEITERNMKSAPPPDLVARSVLRLVSTVQPPPRVTVGDAFQSKIAPLIFRFLPQRLRLWGLKRYYQI